MSSVLFLNEIAEKITTIYFTYYTYRTFSYIGADFVMCTCTTVIKMSKGSVTLDCKINLLLIVPSYTNKECL